MSGPKGHSYRVVSQAELEAREVAGLRARCGAARQRLDGLRAEALVLGLSLAEPDSASLGTLAQWRAREGELQRAIESTGDAIAVERSRQAGAAVRERLGRLDLHLSLDNLTAPRPGENAQEHEESELSQRVDEAVAVLAMVEDEQLRERLTARAEVIVRGSTSSKKAAGLMIALQSDVQQAMRDQRAAEAVSRAISAAALSVAELDDHESGALLHSRLEACRTLQEVARMGAEIAASIDEQARARDRAFVLDQAQGALEDLGYVVGRIEGADERWLATSPRLTDHALQVTFLPGTDRMMTNVVALGSTSAHVDAAAEDATCADLDLVLDRLTEAGIETDRFHERPSGAVPLERLTPVERTAAKPRRRRRAKEREQG